MEQNGFNVEAIKTNDMYNTKVNAGIDMSLSSCHTGFISGYFIEGHVPHDAITKLLAEKPDIKGIGLWSSEMFLMFVLLRIDIFSKGDLALMNSVKRNYNIDLKQTDVLDELINSWSPYKTVASLLLWKSIEEGCFYL